MQLIYPSNNRQMMIKITVKTEEPTMIHLIVKDADRPNTFYMNRYNTINGIGDFYIRLPQSPKRAFIKLYNQKTKGDDGFKIIRTKDKQPFEVLPLETKMDAFDFHNPAIASFIVFAQEFCDKAGFLSEGIYASKDGRYTIKYDDVIRSVATGKELNTPARINSVTGLMQVSRTAFSQYTVAGRFAISCHEFSHVFSNKNPKDEIEADFHACMIYLGLGYPRIEILNVFANVFSGADNQVNRTRFAKIKEFIMNFENIFVSITYS
jgi:hypothetical protein